MKRYIVGRLFQAVLVLLVGSMIVFALARLSGDVLLLYMPPNATPQQVEQMRVTLGLDGPIWMQYLKFVWNILHADLGRSIALGQPVSGEMMKRIPVTLQVAGSAMFVAVIIGIPIGVLSAVRPGGAFDTVGKIVAISGQSMPNFWLALMLMLIFAVSLRWLPVAGFKGPQYLILPAFAVGWASAAALTRVSRSAMLDVLDSEYIKMARIKGVPEFYVLAKHGFKNACIPVMTVMSIQIASMLNGTVIIETIFAIPGMGRIAIESIISRDYPMVQGVVLYGATIMVFMNLLVDLLYAVVDPRIRYVKS